MQSVPIITKVVSLNPVHGEVYSIQHYVIKFVSDFLWFSPGTPVSSTNKTDHHNITEILLKVALNTINQPTVISEIMLAFHNKVMTIEQTVISEITLAFHNKVSKVMTISSHGPLVISHRNLHEHFCKSTH